MSINSKIQTKSKERRKILCINNFAQIPPDSFILFVVSMISKLRVLNLWKKFWMSCAFWCFKTALQRNWDKRENRKWIISVEILYSEAKPSDNSPPNMCVQNSIVIEIYNIWCWYIYIMVNTSVERKGKQVLGSAPPLYRQNPRCIIWPSSSDMESLMGWLSVDILRNANRVLNQYIFGMTTLKRQNLTRMCLTSLWDIIDAETGVIGKVGGGSRAD